VTDTRALRFDELSRLTQRTDTPPHLPTLADTQLARSRFERIDDPGSTSTRPRPFAPPATTTERHQHGSPYSEGAPAHTTAELRDLAAAATALHQPAPERPAASIRAATAWGLSRQLHRELEEHALALLEVCAPGDDRLPVLRVALLQLEAIQAALNGASDESLRALHHTIRSVLTSS
jgi:hypothetical protein